jgi:DNA-binding NarL/FixJ family response regulator
MSTHSGQNRKRVLIVDDQPITRYGLVDLINHQPDLEVCEEADGASNALAGLDACNPDLVPVEINGPDKGGLELIKDIAALRPQLRMLVISI